MVFRVYPRGDYIVIVESRKAGAIVKVTQGEGEGLPFLVRGLS